MKFAALEVARIGMGTNRLANTSKNIAFIKAAVAAGVQLIDTAHLYTGGQSEETIGAALSPMPENVVVATKGGSNGGSPAVIRSERKPAPPARQEHRAVLPAPRRPECSDRNEHRRDQGVRGPRGHSQRRRVAGDR